MSNRVGFCKSLNTGECVNSCQCALQINRTGQACVPAFNYRDSVCYRLSRENRVRSQSPYYQFPPVKRNPNMSIYSKRPLMRNNQSPQENNRFFGNSRIINRFSEPRNRVMEPRNRFNDPRNNFNIPGNRFNDPRMINRSNEPIMRSRVNDPRMFNISNETSIGNRINDPIMINRNSNRRLDETNRN